MPTLYEKFTQGNTAQKPAEAIELPAPIEHKTANRPGLSLDRAQAFENYLATEAGQKYANWERRALSYLGQIDRLDKGFRKAYTTDITDAQSRISKFRGALKIQGLPLSLKYHLPILVGLLLLAAVSYSYGAQTGNQTIELGGPILALALAIIHLLTRQSTVKLKALRALRRTGLSAEGAQNTISYHRSLYGFYFLGGDPQALSDKQFLKLVYGKGLNLDTPDMHFYDVQENLPGKIREFIADAPYTLPTSFPALDVPRLTDLDLFPEDSETEQALQNIKSQRISREDLLQAA